MGGDGGDGGGGDGRFAIPAADSGRATDCWLVWGRAAQLCRAMFHSLSERNRTTKVAHLQTKRLPDVQKTAYSHAGFSALEV